MSNAKHTPTPWKVGDLEEHLVKITTDRNYIHECINIVDVNIMSGNLGEEVPIAVANAELIVKAVNCHDELLAALEAGYAHLQAHSPSGIEAQKLMKSAINKAKGQ